MRRHVLMLVLLALAIAVPSQAALSQTGGSEPDASGASERIDPDCDPDAAAQADPALVEEPDGVCPRPEPEPKPDPEPAPQRDPEPAPQPDPQPDSQPDPSPAPSPNSGEGSGPAGALGPDKEPQPAGAPEQGSAPDAAAPPPQAIDDRRRGARRDGPARRRHGEARRRVARERARSRQRSRVRRQRERIRRAAERAHRRSARRRSALAGRLPDPLPPAKRLDPGFARTLKLVAERSGVSWQLMLAVLRVRGHDSAVPASRSELRALARQLIGLGARSRPLSAVRRLAGAQAFSFGDALPVVSEEATFAERVVALAHYHWAVGLDGLVDGLKPVRPQLARRVLASPDLQIYPGGRADIRSGFTDVRVLVLLLYLGSRYDQVSITSLTAGHSFLTAGGNVSLHSYGRAVDIAALNGNSILGHQQPGGLTERALWRIMLLPRELQPSELISLFDLGGPSFALSDHADHIHVGY